MAKSTQSICKRTRSKSKQTSLLDFDSSSAMRRRRSSVSLTASSTLSNAKNGTDEEDRLSTCKRRASISSQSLDQELSNDFFSTAKNKASKVTDGKSKKRRRVGKTSSKVAKPAAAALSLAKPQDVTSTSISNATSNATSTTKKKKKRATVCLDVITASAEKRNERNKAGSGKRAVIKEELGTSIKTMLQKSSVTPSPDNVARKEAAGKHHHANRELESSSDSSVIGEDTGSSERSLDGSGSSSVGDTSSHDDVHDINEHELEAATTLLEAIQPVKLPSVTMEPSSLSRQHPPKQSCQQTSSSFVPTFHHTWQKPYKPALNSATNSATSSSTALPPGVMDIDSLPHQCCSHSLHSHSSYSWISSSRRCGCVKDANHCSSESLSEAYLARYGVERFGGVGLAGVCGGGGSNSNEKKEEVNAGDWKIEEWWLDQIKREMESAGTSGSSAKRGEANGALTKIVENMAYIDEKKGKSKSSSDARTPSPTSTMSDTSSITSSLKVATTSTHYNKLHQLLPSSVEKHLDYMSRQPDFSVEMRKIVMDWLLEVSEEYKLSSETFWLAVTLVDRSLACSYVTTKNEKGVGSSKGGGRKKKSTMNFLGGQMVVQKENVQLVGCACTLLASKLIEITPPLAEEFAYMTDKTYTRQQILDMESTICNTLKFNLNFVTPFQFVDRFLRASVASSESSLSSRRGSPFSHYEGDDCMAAMHASMNNPVNVLLKKMVFYLLDLAVLEYELVSKKPSLVAASAVYLARATLGIREPSTSSSSPPSSSPALHSAFKGYWSKTLEYYTGYNIWDLEETVMLLHSLQENAEDCNYRSVFNKHKGSKCMRVALKTVVNVEELGFV